jgi:hypothetical protein
VDLLQPMLRGAAIKTWIWWSGETADSTLAVRDFPPRKLGCRDFHLPKRNRPISQQISRAHESCSLQFDRDALRLSGAVAKVDQKTVASVLDRRHVVDALDDRAAKYPMA